MNGHQGTYYAGKSSTLKAVATTAHCAIEGYKSAIETFLVCIVKRVEALKSGLLKIRIRSELILVSDWSFTIGQLQLQQSHGFWLSPLRNRLEERCPP